MSCRLPGFPCGGSHFCRCFVCDDVSIPIGLSMRWRQMHQGERVFLLSQSPSGFPCLDANKPNERSTWMVSIPIGLSMRCESVPSVRVIRQYLNPHRASMRWRRMAGRGPRGEVSIPIGLSMRWSISNVLTQVVMVSQFPSGFVRRGASFASVAPEAYSINPHRAFHAVEAKKVLVGVGFESQSPSGFPYGGGAAPPTTVFPTASKATSKHLCRSGLSW